MLFEKLPQILFALSKLGSSLAMVFPAFVQFPFILERFKVVVSVLPNEPVEASTLPNEPVEDDDPLTPPPANVIALELNSPLQEPLTDLLAVAPKTEFQVPAVTVPTEAKLVALVIEF
jgi:hypothetical protein